MKREVMITAGAAATLAMVMAGCSHSGSRQHTGNAAVAAASASNTKVVVDGKDQNVKGQVACTTAAGTVNIAIGGASRCIRCPHRHRRGVDRCQPARREIRCAGQCQRCGVGRRRHHRQAPTPPRTAARTRSAARPVARTCPTRWPDRSTSRSKST